MRRPIATQLAMPMIAVTIASIATTSLMGAWLIGRGNAGRRQEALDRVVATLVAGAFPLHEQVLRRMAGLSGAEFAVESAGQIVATSLRKTPDGLAATLLASAPSAGAWQGTIEIEGQTYLMRRLPIHDGVPQARARTLLVLVPEDLWWRSAREGVRAPLIVGGLAALASALLAARLAQRWGGPILSLRDQTRRIAAGDFSPAPLPPRDDELRDLTLAINQMTDRLAQYADAVRRHEQLRVLGQLGGGMAHQLRNHAAGARLALELHERRCPAEGPARRSLEAALEQMQWMEDQLAKFLSLGKSWRLVRQPISLGAAIEHVVHLAAPVARHAGTALTFDSPPADLIVDADPDALRQALVNLVLNALEAVGQRTDPQVALRVGRDANLAAIQVIDNGPGPSPEVAETLFEPLVSTRPEGTGLGLPLAREIAQAHGGQLTWRRRGEETVFEMTLPIYSAPAVSTHHGAVACR